MKPANRKPRMLRTLELWSLYDIPVADSRGRPVNMADYRGKLLMIVNTASECGYAHQIEGLEKVYRKYKGLGFEVLAFPSSDFQGQEPLEGKELEDHYCEVHHTTYKIFEKIHVRGKERHPLFQFLMRGRIIPIMWNFHKFLVDRNGNVRGHFVTFISPGSWIIRQRIEKLLAK